MFTVLSSWHHSEAVVKYSRNMVIIKIIVDMYVVVIQVIVVIKVIVVHKAFCGIIASS